MTLEDIKPSISSATYKKFAFYGCVLLLVMGSALMVVFQVFSYRHDFRELNSQVRERDELNAEFGRLLIEKQTFGATAQIGARAVTQLRMYSPPAAQTIVISLPSDAAQKK